MPKEINEGTINQQILHECSKILENEGEFEDWMMFLERKEPAYAAYIQAMTGKMIMDISKSVRSLTIQESQKFAQKILAAFVFTFVLRYIKGNKGIQDILNGKTVNDDQIEAWLKGKLSDKFYNYSTKGLKHDEPKYIAKKAHQELIEKSKVIQEKKKAAAELIKLQQKNGSIPEVDEESIVTDDDIGEISNGPERESRDRI